LEQWSIIMVAKKSRDDKGKTTSHAGRRRRPIKEVEADIIAQTNIENFYQHTLGFVIKGSRPNDDGWLPVLGKDAAGTDEKKSSAAINVGGDPKKRGRYKNQATGESYSIFEAGARFGRLGDWEAVRWHLAEKLGLESELPNINRRGKRRKPKPRGRPPDTPQANGREGSVRGASVGVASEGRPPPAPPPVVANGTPDGKSPDKLFDWCKGSFTRQAAKDLAKTKPPISEDAVHLCGGRAAMWPRKAPHRQLVIAFPAYDARGNVGRYCIIQPNGHQLSKYEGPTCAPSTGKVFSPGPRAGLLNPFALQRLAGAEVVWKVEGVTDMLALQTKIPDELRDKHVVITNSGGCAERPEGYAARLAGKVVYVVGDCDTPGQQGAAKWCNALVGRAAEVKSVVLPFPVEPKHGKDLRDYFGEGHTYEELLKRAADAAPASGEGGNVGASSCGTGATSNEDGNYAIEVELKDDPQQVAARVTEALAIRLPALSIVEHIYERKNELVTVIDDGHGRLRIDTLPKARLVEFLGPRARLLKDGVPTTLPEWLRDAVFARHHWHGLPNLSGVIRCPVLRPDGTLLLTPGYDPATRLLLDWRGEPLAVPENPTKADATLACDVLLNPVAQFPFEKAVHKSSYLAAVLTPLARPAFRGSAPLVLCDANDRGVGKTKLLSCPIIIATGEPPDPTPYSTDDVELDKRLQSCSGNHVVFFDNVTGRFGGGLLDMVLTAPSGNLATRPMWEARLARIDLSMTTWFCTGNNLTLVGDTARRACYIRLQSKVENPSTRGGFRHPDLLGHVTENRRTYLTAALTILRAFHVAGRPGGGLKSECGSFEGWSALVRAAVVWCGLSDPWETSHQLQEEADVGSGAMATLLACWEMMDTGGEGLTTSEVIDKLYDSVPWHPRYHSDMRAAIEDLGCHKNAFKLGYELRKYRGRLLDGRCIEHAPQVKRGHNNKTRWVIQTQPEPEQRDLPLGDMVV
jgi:hypothetical protein